MNDPNKFTQMNSLIKGNCQILALFPIHEKLEMAFLMSSMFVWKNTKSLKPSKQHEAIGYNETLNVNRDNPMDCSPSGSSIHGDSPDKNTGVGCLSLLQGTFPTQGSNLGLLHCRQIRYHPSHQGSPNQ